MTDQSWEERISAYVDGELSPAEREEVARAIDSDPDLKQLYDEWTRMRQVLQALPRVAPRPQLRESVRRAIEGESPARSRPHDRRSRRRAKWLGAAAALASAAVVLVMLIPNIGKETPEHASYEARAEPEHAPTFDASHDVETWEEEASVEEKMAAPAVAEADVAADSREHAASRGDGDDKEHRDFPIERLLNELPEQGRLELVFTASEQVVRQLQETTRSRLGVVRKEADRPAKEEALAMEADAAPRRDSSPVADRAAPLKARRRVAPAPAAPLAKPKAQGPMLLKPTETVVVLRGTRKELREQLAWLSRQPDVQWEKLGGLARLSGQHVPAAEMLKRGRGMGAGTIVGSGAGSERLTEKPGAAEGAGGARGGIMGGGGFSGGFGYGAPQAAPAERSLEKKRGTSPGDHAKKARSESGKKDKKVKGYFGMSNTMEPQNRTTDALVFPSESDRRKDKLPARRVRIVLIIEPEGEQ